MIAICIVLVFYSHHAVAMLLINVTGTAGASHQLSCDSDFDYHNEIINFTIAFPINLQFEEKCYCIMNAVGGLSNFDNIQLTIDQHEGPNSHQLRILTASDATVMVGDRVTIEGFKFRYHYSGSGDPLLHLFTRSNGDITRTMRNRMFVFTPEGADFYLSCHPAGYYDTQQPHEPQTPGTTVSTTTSPSTTTSSTQSSSIMQQNTTETTLQTTEGFQSSSSTMNMFKGLNNKSSNKPVLSLYAIIGIAIASALLVVVLVVVPCLLIRNKRNKKHQTTTISYMAQHNANQSNENDRPVNIYNTHTTDRKPDKGYQEGIVYAQIDHSSLAPKQHRDEITQNDPTVIAANNNLTYADIEFSKPEKTEMEENEMYSGSNTNDYHTSDYAYTTTGDIKVTYKDEVKNDSVKSDEETVPMYAVPIKTSSKKIRTD